MLSSLLARARGVRRFSTAVLQRALVEDLSCEDEHGRHEIGEHDPPYSTGVPPFGIAFCPYADRCHWAAVADEEGTVTLLDTSKSATEQPGTHRAPAHARAGPHAVCSPTPTAASAVHMRAGSWNAHANALFDVTWTPHDARIITASGDQSCRLFDVATTDELQIFHGHTGSVKSVSCKPGDRNVFASSGRDGNVLVWDVRTGAPVMRIAGGHRRPADSGAKRKRGEAGAGGVSPAQSVSSVVYLHDERHMLATAGATDGTVKIWDLRRSHGGSRGRGAGRSSRGRGGAAQAPTPVDVVGPQAGASGRPAAGAPIPTRHQHTPARPPFGSVTARRARQAAGQLLRQQDPPVRHGAARTGQRRPAAGPSRR
jgi:hypothetical protein